METSTSPLAPEVWSATPPESQALIVALQERVRELEARLGQDSSNSSRPPSTDPPQTSAKTKRHKPPSGRKRGGQPGHTGHFRARLPLDQVDQVVVVAPAVCRHCGQAFPSTLPRRQARAWRHQVVEFVGKLTVCVTEHQMQVRRCAQCGKRTRADLPAGIPHGSFGAKLTAVAAMLLGRYRLSRREVQRLVADLWQVPVSLGGVVRLQQTQSVALQPVYAEVRQAVQQAGVVNMDETGWRENRHRAWLWTVVTSVLTVFHIDRSRGGTVVEALLGPKFAGVVGSDRWSAYSRFPATRRAVCYAHLKRDFQALVDRGGDSGAHWSLGGGGVGADVCPLASLPSRRVRPEGIARETYAAEGPHGAVAVAGRGQLGPQGGGTVPGTDQMVGGAVDLHASGGRGADQQRLRARPASGGALAQGKLRNGLSGRKPVCRADDDGGGDLPSTGTAAARSAGGCGRSYPSRNACSFAPVCTAGELNMANAVPDFYLASTEQRKLGEPRACYRLKRIHGDRRDDYLLIRVYPPINGQQYGLGANDIDNVIVATRHVGVSLFPITEWPIVVHVARILVNNPESLEVLHASETEEIDWAALYPTMEAAEEGRLQKPWYVREDER